MVDVKTAVHTVAGGAEICIREAGEGPAIVFIHGSGPGASGASNFRGNIGAFVAAGYRVILPDMIGYGASSKPEGIDYTLDLFAGTLRDALAAHGVRAHALVGNSLGGGVALQLALDDAAIADALILMAPGCIETRERYFSMPGIAKMVSAFGSPDFSLADQRRLIENLVYDAASVSDELVAERYAVARTQPKDVLARMRTPNLQPRLGELQHPILGFWGYNDEFCPESGARYFLDQCANARFMLFNRVGHWVQVERTAEFNAYSIEFLRGLR